MASNIVKILVVGKNSYVGNSFEKYIGAFSNYTCDKISLRNDDWKSINFSTYDSIFYVTGIAHSDNGRICDRRAEEYYKINTDLTIEFAKKVKNDGVKHFVFMSSSIVYGAPAPIGKKKAITKDTIPHPINVYGDSKLQAEIGLNKLNDKNFRVVIIRSPMVYGDNCKGNFRTLKKLANVLPIFPYVDNERSVILIDNLCSFVKDIIDKQKNGIFLPQDPQYMNTSLMVQTLAKEQGKKILLIKGFTSILKFLSHFTPFINKAFGNLVYEKTA